MKLIDYYFRIDVAFHVIKNNYCPKILDMHV
jgi:hypothetical protein